MAEKKRIGIGTVFSVLLWFAVMAALCWECRTCITRLPAAKAQVEALNALYENSELALATAQAEGKAVLIFPGMRVQKVTLTYEVDGVQYRTESEMELKDFKSVDGKDKNGVAQLNIRYDRADPARTVTEQSRELAKRLNRNLLVSLVLAGLYVVFEVLIVVWLLVSSVKDSAERRRREQEQARARAQREQRSRARAERERQERAKREQEKREQEKREQERREQEAKQQRPAADWDAALNDALREAEQRQSSQPQPPEDTVFESGAISIDSADMETQWEDSAAKPEDSATQLDATILESRVTRSDNATLYDADTSLNLQPTEPPASQEVPPDTLQKGSTLLETYRIEDEPRQGAMGSVWRVHHLNWDMDMAMKRALPEAFHTEAQRELFVRECENWVDLGLHPNIVTCYYVRDIEGVPTAFSEWIENGSLKDRIRDRSVYQGTPQEVQERLLDLAIQIARGLHYAHKQKLIHQDVKPDNVLLTKQWEARVSDFGLTGSTGGCTPAYCSPEQAARRKPSRKTDIYSWAVTVLELYLGVRPWRDGPVAGAACQDYFALDEPAAPIPEALKSLLASCLAAETKNRPRDFAAVERELKAVYQSVTGESYPRPAPKEVRDGADILNNRALSYLDLGKSEEAERLWLQAAIKEPAHTETLFNRTLYAYRNGSISLYEAQSYLSSNWENHFNEAAPGLLLAELSAEGRDTANLRDVIGYIKRYSAMQETLSEQVRFKLMQLEALAIGMTYSDEFSYRCSYQISRVRSLAEWEALAKARDDELRGIKQMAKKGHWNDAALHLVLAHMERKLGDVLYQPDWMDFYEELYRHCMPVHVLAQWPIQTVSAVSEVERVSFSDDSRLYLCGQRLYDLQTGELLADHRSAGEAVRCSGLSPDGGFYLRTAADDTVVERVDARTGAVLATMEGHCDTVLSLAISRDGQCLATGDAAGVLRLWDAEGRSSRAVEIMETSGQPLRDIQFGYDRDKMVLCYDGAIVFWTGGDTERCVLPCFKFYRVALDLSCVNLVMAEGMFGMSVFDLKQNQKLELTAETDERQPHGITTPSQVCFMQNDRFLLVSQKKLLFFFDPVTRKILSAIHTAGPLSSMAVTRNGKYIAYTCQGKAHLWRCIYGLNYPAGQDGSEPDILFPCACLHAAAQPDKAPEALLDGLVEELSDRGYGWTAPETALAALRRAREPQS